MFEGLQLTESALLAILKRHGIERFDPAVEGEKFDPNKHEATFQAPQPGKEDGSVFHTQRKGFLYNGRVLRVSYSVVLRLIALTIGSGSPSRNCQEFMMGVIRLISSQLFDSAVQPCIVFHRA